MVHRGLVEVALGWSCFGVGDVLPRSRLHAAGTRGKKKKEIRSGPEERTPCVVIVHVGRDEAIVSREGCVGWREAWADEHQTEGAGPFL